MNLHEPHFCSLIALTDELSNALQQYFQKNILAETFGRDAPFERNRFAVDENIRHLHFCYPSELTPQWLRKNQNRRTSDHFIIYTSHWRFEQLFCVLAVVTPCAHQRIDNLLPQIIQAAQQFNQLNQNDLRQHNWLA